MCSGRLPAVGVVRTRDRGDGMAGGTGGDRPLAWWERVLVGLGVAVCLLAVLLAAGAVPW